MGTLASELGAHAERLSERPRVYVDANVAAGLVAFMRVTLNWDVLFVMEDDALRRARDGEHYRLARQLRRTLITLDRDYLDDRRFPPAQCGGVIVLAAPGERGFIDLLRRLDSDVFHASERTARPLEREASAQAIQAAPLPDVAPLPLEGRKLHVHVDWAGLARDDGRA